MNVIYANNNNNNNGIVVVVVVAEQKQSLNQNISFKKTHLVVKLKFENIFF